MHLEGQNPAQEAPESRIQPRKPQEPRIQRRPKSSPRGPRRPESSPGCPRRPEYIFVVKFTFKFIISSVVRPNQVNIKPVVANIPYRQLFD